MRITVPNQIAKVIFFLNFLTNTNFNFAYLVKNQLNFQYNFEIKHNIFKIWKLPRGEMTKVLVFGLEMFIAVPYLLFRNSNIRQIVHTDDSKSAQGLQ